MDVHRDCDTPRFFWHTHHRERGHPGDRSGTRLPNLLGTTILPRDPKILPFCHSPEVEKWRGERDRVDFMDKKFRGPGHKFAKKCEKNRKKWPKNGLIFLVRICRAIQSEVSLFCPPPKNRVFSGFLPKIRPRPKAGHFPGVPENPKKGPKNDALGHFLRFFCLFFGFWALFSGFGHFLGGDPPKTRILTPKSRFWRVTIGKTGVSGIFSARRLKLHEEEGDRCSMDLPF